MYISLALALTTSGDSEIGGTPCMLKVAVAGSGSFTRASPSEISERVFEHRKQAGQAGGQVCVPWHVVRAHSDGTGRHKGMVLHIYIPSGE